MEFWNMSTIVLCRKLFSVLFVPDILAMSTMKFVLEKFCLTLGCVKTCSEYDLTNTFYYETENLQTDESVCDLRTAFLAHPFG